jgi:hypothetical protein
MKRHAATAALFGIVGILALPGPAAAFSRYNWVPRTGTSYIQADSIGRYTQQWFRWPEQYMKTDLQGSNVTLEVETHLSCNDSTCYGKVVRNAPRPLRGTTWDTNMPNGYLDTILLDDPPIWTVGSSDTRGIGAGVWYQTWLRWGCCYSGETSTDTAGVAYQRGHRDPSWCGDAYCIYSDDTVYVIPRFNQSVPSGKNWTWP